MKELPLDLPGFENRDLKFNRGGLFSSPTLILDGERIKLTKGVYTLKSNTGDDILLKPVHGFLNIDPWQAVLVNNQHIEIRKPLKWYAYCLGCWPTLLVFIGGAIGGAAGACASYANMKIIRSQYHSVLKVLFTTIVGVTAVAFWLGVSTFILMKTNPEQAEQLRQAWEEGKQASGGQSSP